MLEDVDARRGRLETRRSGRGARIRRDIVLYTLKVATSLEEEMTSDSANGVGVLVF